MEKVNSLAAGGAEIISLTAVTMHAVYKELEKRSGIKLVCIPKAVRDEIVTKGIIIIQNLIIGEVLFT